jgi:uncharacterized membrane protein YqaE (UPF0057 family)
MEEEIQNQQSKLLLIEDPICNISRIIKLDKPKKSYANNIFLRNIINKDILPNFYDYYYLLINGKLCIDGVLNWDKLEHLNTIKIYFPLKGGIIDIIIDCVINIGKFFLIILQFIQWFGKFVIWLGQALLWLFLIINPVNVLKDITKTVIAIANSIVLSPIVFIMNLMKVGTNKFFSGIFGSFWGWDNKAETSNDFQSKYFKNTQKKCYVQNEKVPFSVIIGTIFCPPIGVFMELGLSGWFHILLATLLTCAYYLPGLLYALLIIYS